jgi:alpha-ketoglutarate-dependent 2,4-dichlorophenoxyacetate dioxygenase
MEIVPLGPGFAAELRGVTLTDIAADEAAYNATRAAFEEHSVIVFRGQEVTDETQLAFSRRFGPLELTKVGSLGTGTNLVILSTIDEYGKVVPADHRLALRNKANQLWHTDSTFKRVPALASVLSARIIPARGGETEYVSTRLAWERLETASRKRLGKFLRLARLCPFARQDRVRPGERGGARGATAAMLAHGVDESGERP